MSLIIASVPSSFVEPATVTFAIPAGSYTSATWHFAGSYTGSVLSLSITTPNTLHPSPGPSPFSQMASASAAQLSDINNAAGGTLSVGMSPFAFSFGAVVSISSFTLVLAGGGGGNTYIDSGGVIGKGEAGGTDSQGSGGPYVYSELTNATGVGIAGGTDTAQFPTGTYVEVGGVIGVGIIIDTSNGHGPPQTYTEQGGVATLGLPLNFDYATMFESGGMIGFGIPGGTDSAIIAGSGTTYIDYGGPTGKGTPSSNDLLAALESSGAIGKGIAKSTDLAAYTVLTAVISDGYPSGLDHRAYVEGAGVTTKGVPSVVDRLQSVDKSGPISKGAASSTDVIAALEKSGPIAKGVPKSTDLAAYLDHGGNIGKGVVSDLTGSTIYVEVSHIIALNVVGGKNSLQALDKGGPTSEGVAGVASVRVIIEFSGVTGKAVVGVTDHMATTEMGGAIAKAQITNVGNDPNSTLLIPNIRYHCKTVLSNITNFPEGAPDFFEKDPATETNPEFENEYLSFPLCVIVAGEPTEKDTAVNIASLTVPIDIVVAYIEVEGIDNPQAMRVQIKGLSSALYDDYKMFGSGDVPAAFNTRVSSTPMQRVNQYQKYFRDRGQKVEILVLSIECDIVELTA